MTKKSKSPDQKLAGLREDAKAMLESKFPGGFSTRDEANAIAAWAFRNGPLGDLHAGQQTGLLDDKNNSRITDEEMQALMLHACERIEMLLRLKEDDAEQYRLTVMTYAMMYCGEWKR